MSITSLRSILRHKHNNHSAAGRRCVGKSANLSMEPLEDRRLLAITLEHVGTYSTGVFDESAAEIVAHDPDSQRLFVTNANDSTVDVLDIRVLSTPMLLFQIDTTSFGREPTSVDVNDGTLAVAVRNEKGGPAGSVALFDRVA